MRNCGIAFFSGVAGLASTAVLPDPTARVPVSIRATFSSAMPTVVAVGDSGAEHALFWTAADGVDAAVDEAGMLAASPAHLVLQCDVMGPAGRCDGYATFRLSDGESLLTKFSAAIERPREAPESLANAQFSGSWIVVAGPGSRRVNSGGGSIRGRFSNGGECSADWRGEIARTRPAAEAP